MTDINTENISELVEIGKGPVLITYISSIQANWIEYWLEQPDGIVHRNSKSLPTELWDMIVVILLDDDAPLAVIPEAISYDGESWKVLSCVEKEIRPESRLNNGTDVCDFERFLQDPSAPLEDDRFRLKSVKDARTFHVLIPSQDCTILDCNSYLKGEIGVPECISFLWDGDCWVCGNLRWLCPGCTGGIADHFDARMGCGPSLACPMCLGYDFCQEDKAHLQKYYYKEAPEEESIARLAKIKERLRRLTYRFKEKEWTVRIG